MLRVLTCFAVLLVTGASTQAQQPSRLDQIISRGTLRVIVNPGGTPDHPFDFAEKAYWLQRDEALKPKRDDQIIALWSFSDLIIKGRSPLASPPASLVSWQARATEQ